MGRYVVLLRGINVGSARRIAMADLRALLAEAGYTDVRTVLNSGNVVLTGVDGPDHVAVAEEAVTRRTGFDVRCVVLTADELRAIAGGNPFTGLVAGVDGAGSRMMAHVLAAGVDEERLAEAVALDPEHTAAGPHVLYQWCPDGLLTAPPVTAPLGTLVTTRNWNTVTKLAALL